MTEKEMLFGICGCCVIAIMALIVYIVSTCKESKLQSVVLWFFIIAFFLWFALVAAFAILTGMGMVTFVL